MDLSNFVVFKILNQQKICIEMSLFIYFLDTEFDVILENGQ